MKNRVPHRAFARIVTVSAVAGLFAILLLFSDSCKKKDNGTPPTLTTTAVTGVLQTIATSGGNITSEGSASVTARGVCWGTVTGPTTANGSTSDGTGTGSFTSSVTGLTANTTYYLRAYATNDAGTAYGNELSFKTDAAGATVTDADGNIYHTIDIGTQVWMLENLKVTKLNDGTPISLVTDNTAWGALSTAGYCWYNNNASNKNAYGAVYNWYAVTTNKLAPAGWHVPTDADWTTLTTFLGGEPVAGAAMKEVDTTYWISPNTGATNSSGFTARGGGLRDATTGAFSYVNQTGAWWSATMLNSTQTWYRSINVNYNNCYRNSSARKTGFSIRLVRD